MSLLSPSMVRLSRYCVESYPILSSRYQMIPKTPLFLFPLFIRIFLMFRYLVNRYPPSQDISSGTCYMYNITVYELTHTHLHTLIPTQMLTHYGTILYSSFPRVIAVDFLCYILFINFAIGKILNLTEMPRRLKLS